jgi:hypothetical protein
LWDPISKITTTKWTGGMAQAVECLFCKHKAPSSNPRPTKKKKRKSRQWEETYIANQRATFRFHSFFLSGIFLGVSGPEKWPGVTDSITLNWSTFMKHLWYAKHSDSQRNVDESAFRVLQPRGGTDWKECTVRVKSALIETQLLYLIS